MTFIDAYANPATRCQALETALIAHAIIAPQSLPDRLGVSRACGLVLDAVLAEHYADPRIALVMCVAHHVQWMEDLAPLTTAKALEMAADAAAVSVQDLMTIGRLETVVELLAAERRPIRRSEHAA